LVIISVAVITSMRLNTNN